MQWTRSITIGLAKASCTQCHGLGLRYIRHGKEAACNCVFRAVFRACLQRFRECSWREKSLSTVTLEFSRGRDGRRSYSRKTEEFLADFCLIAKRELDEFEHRIFRYHFLLGADWKLCCRQMNLDRGNFFHAVYRIQQKVGRAFVETEPYGIYPLDEYFGGSIRKETVAARVIRQTCPEVRRWVFPLARPAA